MRNILIIGAFGYDNNQLDGQTIKTRNVYNLIKTKHQGSVYYIDTLSVRKKPWLLFPLFLQMIRCHKLIILPCLNNLTILFPVVYYLSKIVRFDIIHICIGGWQVEYFMGSDIKKPQLVSSRNTQKKDTDDKPIWKAHPFQMKLNKKIKVVMPEMKTEVEELINIGFNNLEFFPNFRIVNSGRKSSTRDDHPVLRLVFMARVMRMKGYDIVFNFSEYAKLKNMDVQIDFYGQINPEEETEFKQLVKDHSDNVNYCGYLAPDSITSTLINYDMMMLPTHFYTESLPGTILDSYIAGIPIIATRWKYASEFIDEGRTGFIVPFENGQDEFNRKIEIIYHNRELLNTLKKNARDEAYKYSEEVAWNRIKKYLYD